MNDADRARRERNRKMWAAKIARTEAWKAECKAKFEKAMKDANDYDDELAEHAAEWRQTLLMRNDK